MLNTKNKYGKMINRDPDFFDIIAPENVLYMLKRFSKVTGLGISVTSINGKTVSISSSRLYTDFYSKIKEENSTTVKNYFLKNIHKNKTMFYNTPSGLNYMGFNIDFKGRPVAVLILEAFFYAPKKPPDDFFITHAQKYGFNLDKFLSTLEHVPVLVKNAVDRIADNCTNFVSMLTYILENKTQADNNRKKLRTADNMLELLSYSADTFLTKTQISQEVNELLYKISESLEIDVIMICRVFKTQEGKSVLKTYWYHSTDEFSPFLQKLTLDGVAYKEDLGIYYDRLKHGQQIFVSPSAFKGKLGSIMKHQGVKTAVVTPIFSGSSLWGMMFFENIEDRKDFSPIQLQTVEYIADVIGAALKREHYITLLNKNRRKYRLVSENMSDLIWMMDTDFNITYVSPSCQKVLGYTPVELSGINIKNLLPPDKYDYIMSELKEELEKARKKIISKNYSRSMEIEQMHKNGRFIWTEVRISFISDEEGNPVSIVGVTRDITERRHNRHLIESSKNQIENTKKSNMDFLTGVAREIIPPLKTLSKLSGKLSGRGGGRKIDNIINRITHDSTSLTALLDTILQLNRFKAGKEVLDFKEFNLLELLNGVVDKYKSAVERKPIKLNFDYSPNMPVEFKGDSVRVSHILSILLENAVNFTDKGEISVSVESDKSDKAALYAFNLTVTDTGSGISPGKQKEISKLFENDFVLNGENLNYSTTGLALVNVLARKMDGSLSFQSKHGGGTTFKVKLHMVRANREYSGSTASTEESSFENARILLSFHKKSNDKIGRVLAEKFGCRVEVVRARKEFLKKAEDKKFDLIIIDLPVHLAGIETAQAIRGHLNPTVAIMVITNKKLDLDKYPGVDDSLADYGDTEKLRQKLAHWIKK